MAFQIFNQVTQPLELTGGATLTVNGNVTVRELGERERSLAAAGHIFVRQIETKATQPKTAKAPTTETDQVTGNTSGK